jgi:hypothetical protein
MDGIHLDVSDGVGLGKGPEAGEEVDRGELVGGWVGLHEDGAECLARGVGVEVEWL